jgi:UDP-N-acetylmuramoylalanine--D-glutamate ligase
VNTDSKIAIIGAGVEGLAAAKYFKKHCLNEIILFDQRETDDAVLAESLADLPLGVRVYGGADYLEKAAICDVLVRSPGIHIEKVKAALRKMKRTDAVTVTSTTQYFMENCPYLMIGVTGTKGKGTTSTLITLMLKEAGYSVYLGGNIGQSPLEFLDEMQENSIAVLEMSSFQLQDLRISPQIAVVLRVTSDHLDYHKNVEEYRAAKSATVRFQEPNNLAIFNEDYDDFEQYADQTPARKLTVSTRNPVEAGAYVEEGEIVFVPASEDSELAELQIVGEVGKVALIGAHHLENVLPAVCVARSLNVPISAIQKVLYSFAGLPHRLEFAKEIDGVKYYNDSFSTTPDTSVAASYAFKNPVILIAGGSEKFADYKEWGIELQKNPRLKMVLLMGQTAPKMEEALNLAASEIGKSGHESAEIRHSPLAVYRCKNLEEALMKARENAVFGDVVVMSPAAASFDQFKNYKQRGEQFKELVKKIAR